MKDPANKAVTPSKNMSKERNKKAAPVYTHSVQIENVYPEIDRGRYPVKRELGQTFWVYTDVYKEGHDSVAATLLYRLATEKSWHEIPMEALGNHRFKAGFKLEKTGSYLYKIQGFPAEDAGRVSHLDRILEVVVDPVRARYSTWYEMFPRSQGTKEGQSATFKEMEARLPEIHEMGFDVIYLTPIHPIGETNRKGPNNSLICSDNDPGCPYSIGNAGGGHKAVDPNLGTLTDFKRFVRVCQKLDMQVALDIVHTCSPDHPYIKEHPDWFYYNEDGSLKFAENPPKKYEDVVPMNFYPKDTMALWDEMVSIFTFWIEQGVQIFRVDNPHTKPIPFWEYCIGKVKRKYPDTIFLSEAFTHPKMMYMLAKVGFTQSYSYFTWRNTKFELRSYIEELAYTDVVEYFRPNFFTNTPDILPPYLQTGGRNAFKIRQALAATLSPSYGIYNGFELCENAAIPGKEEYINSEKYEFKVWDWDRPGNIKAFIRAINRIRKENLALQDFKDIHFVDTNNDNILAYIRCTQDLSNIVLVAVNLDPYLTQNSYIYIPIHHLGIASHENYTLFDLLSGETYIWKGDQNYIKLDPNAEPIHIFRIGRWRTYDDFPRPKH